MTQQVLFVEKPQPGFAIITFKYRVLHGRRRGGVSLNDGTIGPVRHGIVDTLIIDLNRKRDVVEIHVAWGDNAPGKVE